MPNRRKPGWILMTGNFKNAKKNNIPDTTPIRVNLCDWLGKSSNTVLLQLSFLRILLWSRQSFHQFSHLGKTGTTSSQSSSDQAFSFSPKYSTRILVINYYDQWSTHHSIISSKYLSFDQLPSNFKPLLNYSTPLPFFLPLRRYPLYLSPLGIDS